MQKSGLGRCSAHDGASNFVTFAPLGGMSGRRRRSTAAAAAGRRLLQALRDERSPASGTVELQTRDDGAVRICRCLACTLSPVLRAALAGSFKESATGTYEVREHSAEHVQFAFDFLCGDESRHIDGDNAMALLALADALELSALKGAAEAALLALLATSNAAELLAAAERYRCAELREAAEACLSAKTSALADCMQSILHPPAPRG